MNQYHRHMQERGLLTNRSHHRMQEENGGIDLPEHRQSLSQLARTVIVVIHLERRPIKTIGMGRNRTLEKHVSFYLFSPTLLPVYGSSTGEEHFTPPLSSYDYRQWRSQQGRSGHELGLKAFHEWG